MRIAYHLGAHCTDEDRLIRCFLKNRAVLAEQGILVPSPTRYRRQVREISDKLGGQVATPETQAMMLEQIIDDAEGERIVLSWDSFMGFPTWAVGETFYPRGGEIMRAITRIFPDHSSEFFLAIRNPATFLPALQAKIDAKGSASGPRAMVSAIDPFSLRWSDTVRQILRNNPGVPLTVWCDEETPLIEPEIMQAISGHAAGTLLADSDEVLAQIMTDIGIARMRNYCKEHPPQSVSQRRRVVTAFLEKFARPERVEVEIDVPGWTDETVAQLSDLYLRDVAYISGMAGVRLIEA
ncbi:hypothetical protein [Tabrizicola caldifontis]|uniref:hypothetical protein n=1 Tax=Tabrizicola caldifontis TaxID=2528036 RepID=UPI00108045C9|nr:hypothetical protein [Rhodobacter sp. YIM 73028]